MMIDRRRTDCLFFVVPRSFQRGLEPFPKPPAGPDGLGHRNKVLAGDTETRLANSDTREPLTGRDVALDEIAGNRLPGWGSRSATRKISALRHAVVAGFRGALGPSLPARQRNI